MSEPLFGLMMDYPLTVTQIMRHAERVYPDGEVVSVTADNPQHRCTYSDVFRRTRQLANVLKTLGATRGDRIATLAWNDYRHLELYYAIQCSGMVCHTINPRLFPEQVQYIVNHAEDQFIFVDKLIFPLVEKLAATFETVKGIVVMTDEANMPETAVDNVHCYETLLAGADEQFDWPVALARDALGDIYDTTTGQMVAEACRQEVDYFLAKKMWKKGRGRRRLPNVQAAHFGQGIRLDNREIVVRKISLFDQCSGQILVNAIQGGVTSDSSIDLLVEFLGGHDFDIPTTKFRGKAHILTSATNSQ